MATSVGGLLGLGCGGVDGWHYIRGEAESCRFGARKSLSYRQLRRSLPEESLRRPRRPKSLAEFNIARLAPAAPTASIPVKSGASVPVRVRILGLDPGSQCTGYAVVETGARVTYVVSGSIRTRGGS